MVEQKNLTKFNFIQLGTTSGDLHVVQASMCCEINANILL